jgi:hypothetical protein
MPRNEAKGLYFPYANIRSIRTLKTAVLYFDKVGVINPDGAFCDESRLYDHVDKYRQRYISDTETLVRERIIEWVNPASVIAKYGREIMMGVVQDIYDEQYIKLCEPFANSPWVLASTKLPNDADKWLRNMLVNVPTLARGGSLVTNNTQERYLHESLRFREGPYGPIYYEGKRNRYAKEYESQSIRGGMFDEYRLVELPFNVGESIMIGHTLAAAAEEDYTPFCDEPIHFEAWKAKSQRYTNNKAVKAVLREYGYLKDTKADLLAQEVINQTVPSLEGVSLSAILRFRKKRRKELEEFREKMQMLISEVEETPWDDDFSKRVRDVVDSQVKPALSKIEHELLNCKDAFWKGALEAIGKVAPLPVVASLFSGVPAHVAVALGGSLAGLTVVLDQWAKRRRIKRNGWAFLINSQRLANKKNK